MRRAYAVVRLFVVLGPLLCLALWAVGYLRACYGAVLAPGVPVKVQFATPGGNLNFAAASYSFNPRTGFLVVSQPQLLDPDGKHLASAKLADVAGIDLFDMGKTALKVHVYGLAGNFVREADGRFQFQSFLGPKKAPSQPIPFDVTVDSAQLNVIDNVGVTQWSRQVSATDVRVAGIGSSWLAAATLQVPGVLDGRISVSHDTTGDIAVETVAKNWQVADVARHVISTLPAASRRALAAYDVSTLRLSGPVSLAIGQSGPPRWQFDGSVDALGGRALGASITNAHFAGRITDADMRGSLTAMASGAAVNAKGWVGWRSGKLQSAAVGSAKLTSIAVLPASLRKVIPTTVAAKDVAFDGAVSFDGRTGVAVDGTVRAASGGYGSDVFNHLAGEVRVAGTTLWTRIDSAMYGAAPVSGELNLDWKSRRLFSAVRSIAVPVETILQRFPDAAAKLNGRTHGTLSGLALISGTAQQPQVDFQVRGSGSYADATLPRAIKLERALIDGHYKGGQLLVQRFRARTPAGVLTGLGTVNVTQRTLDVDVDGRGLDVADFTTEVTGLASISGSLSGSFDAPLFEGQIEGYDLGYRGTDVALTTAQITATQREIDAGSVNIVVGSSQIEGSLSLDLKTKALGGSLSSNALQLGDFLGETFAGLVTVHTSDISGTLENPRAVVTATGSDLLADDLPIAGLTARVQLTGDQVTLDQFEAHTATGLLTATGRYDIKGDDGQVAVVANRLDLATILPSVQKNSKTLLAGNVGGNAVLNFTQHGVTNVSGRGNLDGVKANGTDLGAGVWNVAGTPHRLQGSAQVGTGPRFLALENATIDIDAHHLDADVVASNLSIQNIYQFTAPYMSTGSEDVQANRLALLDADLKFAAHVAGDWANPDIDLTSLDAERLTYNGTPFGAMKAAGRRQSGVWNITSMDLVDGTAKATAHGTIDENGQTALDGEFNNFELSKLASAFPSLPAVGGLVSSSFRASGPTKAPHVRATLDAESVAVNGRRVDFGLNFDTITVDETGIVALGAATYDGFHAQIDAHVPFAYPFAIPDNAPISVKLTLNQRPLQDLVPYVATVDPKRAEGAINGALALTGKRDALHLSGGVNLRASVLGFRAPDPAGKPEVPKYVPLATELKDVVLSLGVQDDALTADVAMKSSRAGSIDGEITAKLAALDELLTDHSIADADTWLASIVSGKVALNDVSVKESNKLVNSSFALNGALTLGGSLGAPTFGGNIDIADLSTTIPTLTAQGSTTSTAAVDPTFDIQVALFNPGRISTSLAGIELNGRGHIGGTLSRPDATAFLSVVRGDLRLPGGKVSLAPGGTVRPIYQVDPSGTAEAHVTVDLYGDSHVTTVRNGDLAERYDVHLEVRGDLLAPDQVAFTATSDPPDLSQDQILALLGRTDLLSALGSNTGYSQGERQLQTAALGYALPSIFDPITSRLAANLGLDYLSLEYNALDQTSLLTSKSLGHGFSFQVRRQVSLPSPGFPLTYDYRLVYQLPTRSALVRRFSFFLGRDELVPWKIGFQYGQRL